MRPPATSIVLGLVLCAALWAPAGAAASRGAALVIGNASYSDAPLANPVNDASDMASLLQALDFDVAVHRDASLREMEDAIRSFWRKLSRGLPGLFYYAGHAIELDGRNYLLPIGAEEIASSKDVKYKAVDVGQILDEMQQAGNPLNVVILDACRNNPFRSFRGLRVGLARVDGPRGSLIAYATAPGSVAADGSERNGIFTKHLLRSMREPGIDIEEALKRARIAVHDETGGRQTPWVSSSIMGDFVLQPRAGAELPPLPDPARPEPQTRTQASGRFQVESNGIIFDSKTGLEWFSPPQRTFTHKEATIARDAGFLPGSDWDLPSENQVREFGEGGLMIPAVRSDPYARFWLVYSNFWTSEGQAARFLTGGGVEAETLAASEKFRALYVRSRR